MRLSTELAGILSVLGNNSIASVLLSNSAELKLSAIDYISYTIKDGDVVLTYMPKSRMTSTVEDAFKDKRRQFARVGKVVKKLIPSATDVEVALFVKKFTSLILDYKLDISIIKGKDIRKWYHEDSYALKSVGTPLGQSCMRHPKCQDYFSIYENNPDQIEMVIGTIDGVLRARALRWMAYRHSDAKRDLKQVLDRIYYVSPLDHDFMQRWGFENCDLIREDRERFTDKEKNTSNMRLDVPIKDWRHYLYPYMDTFITYSKDDECLTNWILNSRARHLQKTDGSYKDYDNDYAPPVRPGFVWIERLRREIKEADVVMIHGFPYDIAETLICKVCEERKVDFVAKVAEYGDVCVDHLNPAGNLDINGKEYIKCIHCRTFTTEGKACDKCKKKYKPCECGGIMADQYTKFTVDGKNMCHKCYFEKYGICYNCEELKPAIDLNEELICTECRNLT